MASRYLALLLLLAACGGRSEALPEDLLQVWRTAAPGYHDRFFELREDWVVFGTGRYTSAIHKIQAVTSEAEDGRTRFTIEYRAEDGALLPLEVVFTPGTPAYLQVGRQPAVWLPEAHADWLKRDASG